MIAASFLLSACAAQTATAGSADTSKNNAPAGTGTGDAANLVATPLADEPADIVITPGIKGTSVTLNVGQVFEIQIPTIPSPNYTWVPQNLDAAMISQVGSADYMSASGQGQAANGGFVVLKFKALAKGQTTVNLVYELSSADTSAPSLSAQSMSITVNVN